MILKDSSLQRASYYYYSEEWQGIRAYIQGHPMAQECRVFYKQGGLTDEFIGFQLIKADGQRTKLWWSDLDKFIGATLSFVNDLLWDLSDTEIPESVPA